MGALLNRQTLLLRVMILITAAAIMGGINAAPVILEESAKIVLPDSRYRILDMALSGDRVVVTAFRLIAETSEIRYVAFLFERTSEGEWEFTATLYDALWSDWTYFFGITAAMEGDVVALAVYPHVHVLEWNGSAWVQTAALEAPEGYLATIGSDVEIDSGTILVGGQAVLYGAAAYRKNAAGEWAFVQAVTASLGIGDDEFIGGDVDISGTTMILASPRGDSPSYRDEVHIFEGPYGAAQRTAILASDPARNITVDDQVALSDGLALVGSVRGGASMYRRIQGFAFWEPLGSLQPLDVLTIPGGADYKPGYNLDSRRIYIGTANDDRGPETGSVDVYERSGAPGTPDQQFPHVARLLASDASDTNRIGGQVSMSGNRVAVFGTESIYIFDLTEELVQPDIVQEDLEDGYADNWNPLAQSAWSVVSSGGTTVYRQSNLAGDARAILQDSDWTNQAVETDVKALSFAAANQGWFGLFVRYTDANNFYYLTVRNGNTVQIRKIVDGVFQSIVSAPLPVATNRAYRLRLEAVGTWLRAYVNGRLVLQAIDRSHSHGQAGLTMYRTSAEYDNILVTPNPSLNLAQENFEDGAAQDWTLGSGGTWTIAMDGSQVYRQTSVEAGDARSIVDHPSVADQIIEADAKAIAFAPGDRWFGLIVRYQGDANYHYVTMRSGGSISLRQLRAGVVTVLDTAPMNVTPGTWYKLRFEAIGRSMRVYVDNRLVLEAVDDSQGHSFEGKAGVMTYKASAQYDNVVIRQP